MKLLLRFLAILLIALLALVALAVYKPVLASKLIWPAVEFVMLREPFVGITADGVKAERLYRIESTGNDTGAIVAAATAFIGTLNNDQRQRLSFPVDDLEWRRWANIHISTRNGVGLLELNESQTAAALGLLDASLSARGLATAKDIMRLEGHLADLMNDHEQYGEKRYWLTLMGEPSTSQPWGWQIDGHHLIINYFVLGDQVVMTPTFMGSEPPRADHGRYAGTSILDAELTAGLALVNSLDAAQRSAAVIEADKVTNNNHGELFQDNAVIPYQGIRLSELSIDQRELAVALIGLYIDNMKSDQARIKMEEVVRHWDDTYFAWIGRSDSDSVFYYRIHSPVLMIEYDHQVPVALDGPQLPSRNHVHTVVRTPNGNDYGKDLLRLHRLQVAH